LKEKCESRGTGKKEKPGKPRGNLGTTITKKSQGKGGPLKKKKKRPVRFLSNSLNTIKLKTSTKNSPRLKIKRKKQEGGKIKGVGTQSKKKVYLKRRPAAYRPTFTLRKTGYDVKRAKKVGGGGP